MVSTALQAASLAFAPPKLFLADSVQVYKPATKIYEALLQHINANLVTDDQEKLTRDRVWLVSGYVFDLGFCEVG